MKMQEITKDHQKVYFGENKHLPLKSRKSAQKSLLGQKCSKSIDISLNNVVKACFGREMTEMSGKVLKSPKYAKSPKSGKVRKGWKSAKSASSGAPSGFCFKKQRKY